MVVWLQNKKIKIFNLKSEVFSWNIGSLSLIVYNIIILEQAKELKRSKQSDRNE